MKIGPTPIRKAMVNLNISSITPAMIGGPAVPKPASSSAFSFFLMVSGSLGSTWIASKVLSANWV